MQDGFPFTQAAQDFFKDKYLARREDAFDVRVSPLLENKLAGLPPAYVITAGFDPLHDEGRAYADKMAACGVSVTHRHYAKAPHGFFNMTAVSTAAKTAIAEAGRWLNAALA
jgi:acetyl esterase